MTMTEERPMPPLSDPMDEAALLAVDDPRERLRLAAESARLAAERGDKARDKRNAAARQLAQTRKAVRVWKDTLGITRNLWTGSASEETRRWDKVATDARRIRDETATGLMNGAYGPPARNAEVVALTGLTSARVAQLRTSY
jgi:hypothetical protein